MGQVFGLVVEMDAGADAHILHLTSYAESLALAWDTAAMDHMGHHLCWRLGLNSYL